MSKTILVDLDGICVNLLQAILDTYNLENREPGEEVTVADITTQEYAESIPGGDMVYSYPERPGWWSDLPVIPGARRALKHLQKKYDVVICTSPGNWVEAPSGKMAWVFSHLSFLPKKNLVITRRKDLIKGDALIDDSTSKLEKYGKAWPKAQLLTIAWPYNTDSPAHFTAQSWEDTEKAWDALVRRIEKTL